MHGVVLKGVSGFYSVMDDSGSVHICKARGNLRKKKMSPLAGDDVDFVLQQWQHEPEIDGCIESVYTRKNHFDRPPAANVSLAAIVMAPKDPELNLNLLDRFAISAEQKGISLEIVINKSDLITDAEKKALENAYKDVYPIRFISALNGDGSDELATDFKGKRVVLAGPSGVGKSSIVNMLAGRSVCEVGVISAKLARGKNTTRHTEMLDCGGFYLFDTPGFSCFESDELKHERADMLFPEFIKYIPECEFNDCRHINETHCAVKTAVAKGLIPRSRYESYVLITKEIDSLNKY